uniref:Zinc finger CCCH domain-containing protein 6 n=1 Tax=Calidris pygmaea TaxID=425635 RepID=A0A8C3JJC9_9CHAR
RPPTFYNSASPPRPPFQGNDPHSQHMYNPGSSPGPGPGMSQGHNGPPMHPGSPGHHPCAGPQGPGMPQSPPMQGVPPGFLGPQNQTGMPMQGQQGDDNVNWYSSSEEEEGSSVKSILKTLKKQSENFRNRQQHSTEQHMLGIPTDPRLAKEKGSGPQAADPRLRASPRSNPRKPSESASLDPRLVRDPRMHKVSEGGHAIKVKQKGMDDDEEDSERELRERAFLIPLEPLPGVTLRDPRSQLRQFSHIKMDVTLMKPNFAKHIVWAPEDLLPIPLPKPDPVSSINLPLPPLIADQRLNKMRNLKSDPHPNAMPADPRLAAKAKNNLTGRSGYLDPSADSHASSSSKLGDPRLQKNVDPRLHRLSSADTHHGVAKDSHPPKFDPRLARSAAEALPPYAPKLSSSGVRLGTPGSILSGISLYDPRDHSSSSEAAPASSGENGENQKKSILKNSGKNEPSLSEDTSLQKTASSVEKNTEGSAEATSDKANSTSKSQAKHSSAAPAVHNLPIQALSGLIRPQYSDPRQVRQPGQVTQTQDNDPNGESDDKSLKDVFKTFDPTASPFC